MTELQEELNGHFETFIETKDSEKSFYALTEYLRFIQEAPTLKAAARQIFSDGRLPVISRLYKALERAWLEDDNAAKEMWADVNRKILGKTTVYKLSGITRDMQMARAQARLLHLDILEGLVHTLTKGKVIIFIRKGKRSVCSAGENEYCYPDIGAKRFKIIVVLLSEKASAGLLATRSGKTPSHAIEATIKNEIIAINKNFKKKVRTKDDLIVHRKYGKKNIYSLNYKVFDFRLE